MDGWMAGGKHSDSRRPSARANRSKNNTTSVSNLTAKPGSVGESGINVFSTITTTDINHSSFPNLTLLQFFMLSTISLSEGECVMVTTDHLRALPILLFFTFVLKFRKGCFHHFQEFRYVRGPSFCQNAEKRKSVS